MSTIINNLKLRVLLAFVGIYIIWGTTYLAISYGLKGFPPFILSGFRFLVAGVIILLWLWKKGEKPNSLTNWYKNFIPGIFILAIGVGLVAWAEQYLSSTEAAIIMASEPFWFILLDKKNWKNYLSNPLVITGLVIGMGGLLLFLKDSLQNGAHTADNTMRYASFGILFISSLLWVLGSLFSKNRASSHSIFMNVGQQLIIGGVASLIIASALGEWTVIDWSAIPLEAWSGLAYLIVFGSIIAYLSFIWLLSIKPPALVSTHTYVNPVVAVVFGWIIANENITGMQTIGLLVILLGVLLTNMINYKITKRSKVKWRKVERIFLRNNGYKHSTN
jgi:drug/metabolite transporter (DMT)-like permease